MQRRKKIVIFYTWLKLWSMKSNSGAPSFYKTIEAYVKKGYDVKLVTINEEYGILPPDNVYVMRNYRFDRYINIKIIGKLFIRLKIKAYNKYAKKVTKKIIRSVGKDNIVFYAYEVHGVKAAKWASKKFGRKLITRFQGTVLTYEKDTLIHRIKRYPFYQALTTVADLVIMTNDGTQGLQTLERLGNKSKNIKFWMNGVDLFDNNVYLDKDFKAKIGLEGEKILLTVSRLEHWKRVDRAIRVFAEVKKNIANSKLIIIGEGKERKSLEELVETYGLQDEVNFLGAIPHNEVFNYMNVSDIFMSLYDMSNVGNPLLEAASLGVCIVTLNVGDTASVIQDGYNGKIVNLNEIDTLPMIVTNLLKNPDERIRLGNNAQSYVDCHLYSWEQRMNMELKEVEKLFL